MNKFKSVMALSLSLAIMNMNSDVLAKSSNQLEKEKVQAEQRKNAMSEKMNKNKGEINSLEGDVAKVNSEIEKLDAQIASLSSNISKLETDISSLNKDILATQAKLEKAQAELVEKQDLFGERVKSMYMNGKVSYVEVLLNSKNMEDLIKNNQMISTIAESDKELVDYITKQVEIIDSAKKELDTKKMALTTAKASLEGDRANFVSISKAKSDYMQSLEANIDAYKAEFEKSQENWNNLDDEIRRLQAEIRNAKNKENSATKSAAINRGPVANMGTSSRSGKSLSWPVPGNYRISSPYGYRIHPVLGISKFHSGVDIPASTGTPIIAAKGGVVIMSQFMRGYGNVVMIDHGDTVTVYAHNSVLKVGVGDSVSAGDVVSLCGSTGMSTGPHLHFEVRVNGSTVDPLGYI